MVPLPAPTEDDPDPVVQTDYVPFTAGQTFPKPTWKQCYDMDWGLGGTKEQGEAERAACIAVRDQLRTPQ